jgi:hypothetical protein
MVLVRAKSRLIVPSIGLDLPNYVLLPQQPTVYAFHINVLRSLRRYHHRNHIADRFCRAWPDGLCDHRHRGLRSQRLATLPTCKAPGAIQRKTCTLEGFRGACLGARSVPYLAIMRNSPLAGALFGAMILQSLNAGASGGKGAPIDISGLAAPQRILALQPAADSARPVSGVRVGWDTVKRFRSGNPPASNTAPGAGSPPASDAAPAAGNSPASDTAPAAGSPPSGSAAQPTTVSPKQGDSANTPDSGTAPPEAAEGTPSPNASGQPAEPKPEGYKAPSVENTPAGVTIYRGP